MRASVFALMACLAAAPALASAEEPTAPPSGGSPEVIATASGAPSAPNQTADPQLARWLAQAPPIDSLGSDYRSDLIGQPADRRIHGEVGVGVGTGGYRDAYVSATMPVGRTGELGLALEDTQYPRPYRYEQRSLAVSLEFGGASAAPQGCDSAFRVGDHFVEPLWATQIRGSALAGVDPRCMSAGARLR